VEQWLQERDDAYMEAVKSGDDAKARVLFDEALRENVGNGITPFIARLQALIKQPDGKAIDLFYSTNEPDEGFIERVRQLAKRAGVRLHVLVTARDGRLNGERIRQEVPEWSAANIWFCGPAGFGQALSEDFNAHGLSPADFHQELFDMR
ncbi:MAG: hypothetical protein IIZ69_08405, partial [Pseudomonas sp.]|nr:hypothetical protein [Pseudomonas sp.]